MKTTLKSLEERVAALEICMKGKEPSLKFEDHNFCIDSTGWKKKVKAGITCLENPEGDVWEYVETPCPELKGEQLFTWDAAMRETKKAGKRVPTDDEFSELLKTKEDMPNLLFAGYRYTDGSFVNLSSDGYFWSSPESGSSAWYRDLNSGCASVYRNTGCEAVGFSVRCLAE